MAQNVLSVVISDTPPIRYRGSLWIKYKREDNSYELMLPTGNGWISAGPSDGFIDALVNKLMHPSSGDSQGSFNGSFNQSFDTTGSGKSPIELTMNKVTALSETSTDDQYPSAKAVYEAIQNAGGGSEESAIKRIIVDWQASVLPDQFLPNIQYVIYNIPSDGLFLSDSSLFKIPEKASEPCHWFLSLYPSDSLAAATSIIAQWPIDWEWVNDDALTSLEVAHTYQVSVLDGVATYIDIEGAASYRPQYGENTTANNKAVYDQDGNLAPYEDEGGGDVPML